MVKVDKHYGPTHITDYLQLNAKKNSDKPAIIFQDETISWSQLWSAVEPTSANISQRVGITQQEVVAILMPNSIEFIVTYLAILHSGHIALPLDPAYKTLELDAIIDQIPSKLLIADGPSVNRISAKHNGVVNFKQISQDKGLAVEVVRLPAAEQIASLTFTSGTTGKPKAVPNTHSNHIWNIQVCSQVWDWTPKDSLLISLPLSHWYGLVMGLSGVIYHANTLYLQQWFNETDTLVALSSGKITMFTHAASAYVKLVASADKDYDLSSVRLCISGGAPLPPAVWQEFKDHYGIEIVETYGSSETGRIAGNTLSKRMLGSPGKVLPGVALRLGSDGEVQIKSAGVFPGYFNNPAATKQGLTNDGYWRTGDIAELKDGYVFLKGRTQEHIRRYGYTISPRDVEWAMHKNPQVKDIYVLGSQQAGQPNDQLVYFIVTDLTDEQIKDYTKANLLFAWRPDTIIHLDELPRTKSGKVQITTLKKMSEAVA